MQLTSVASTIEASKNVPTHTFISDLIPLPIKGWVVNRTAGPETIAGFVVDDLPETPLEYNEIVDLKTLSILLFRDIDISKFNEDEYPKLKELYTRAFSA